MTYFKLFRLVFFLFNVVVVVDVIYRRADFIYYYASFGRFIPTFSLVTIFWSVFAVMCSILLWLTGKLFERVSSFTGIKVKSEHYLLFMLLFCFLTAAVWIIKIETVSRGTTISEKLIVLFGISFPALFLPWFWRSKIDRLFEIIDNRIAPLVKLFGVLIVLHIVIVVSYIL